MPKRKNLPTVRPASDLGDRAMGLSILCWLERVKGGLRCMGSLAALVTAPFHFDNSPT